MRSKDRDHPGQHGETPSLLKIQKISWAWWRVPVIPATWEAEAELLEPRRRRLPWVEIEPLHSSLGNKSETLSQKKQKTKNQKKKKSLRKGPEDSSRFSWASFYFPVKSVSLPSLCLTLHTWQGVPEGMDGWLVQCWRAWAQEPGCLGLTPLATPMLSLWQIT